MTTRASTIRCTAATAIVLAAMALTPSLAGAALSPADQAAAQKAGEDAFVYGYPLMQTNRLLGLGGLAKLPNDPSGKPYEEKFPLNTQLNLQFIATPETKAVVLPNADTIYTIVNLDVGTKPALVHYPTFGRMPDGKNRYWGLELLDSWTNVFDYIGTRKGDTTAGDYAIVGPNWNATSQPLRKSVKRVIRATTPRVWVIGRILVDNARDIVQNAAALQSQIRFTRPGDGRLCAASSPYYAGGCRVSLPSAKLLPVKQPLLVTPSLYALDELGAAMATQPAPSGDSTLLSRLASWGIGTGLSPSTSQSADVKAALLAGMQTGFSKIEAGVDARKAASLASRNGWVLFDGVGTYGTDYMTRAIIADFGLGANVPAEAIYPAANSDSTGAALTGSRKYRIHFNPGQTPPNDAFWSITLYGEDKFFVSNSANRYAVGDRTGMVRNADGSLDILIQPTKPDTTKAANVGRNLNWLPSPANKPFLLTMRIYLPKAITLNGTWKYPKITRVP